MGVETFDALSSLLERGGIVLIAIVSLSTLMWALIIERYWYVFLTHPARLGTCVATWERRADRSSWRAHRVRRGLVVDLSQALHRNLPLIRTLVGVLPLLGLLGTVTGMVVSFEVMTTYGTRNLKGLAAGISQALLTTTAGLVMSLSGLYFSNHLELRAKVAAERAAGSLVFADSDGGSS